MLDHVETWHTCSLGEYLGGVFFIFSKFSFLDPRDPFSSNIDRNGPKTLGQPTELKHCWIMLKLGTLVLRVNTWGWFFSFFQIFYHWATETLFGLKLTKTFRASYGAKTLLDQVETCLLGHVFYVLKFLIFRPWVLLDPP